MNRISDRCGWALTVGVLALLLLFAMLFTSCSARRDMVGKARPKYGEPTVPIGPDPSHWPKSQPKFKP